MIAFQVLEDISGLIQLEIISHVNHFILTKYYRPAA